MLALLVAIHLLSPLKPRYTYRRCFFFQIKFSVLERGALKHLQATPLPPRCTYGGQCGGGPTRLFVVFRTVLCVAYFHVSRGILYRYVGILLSRLVRSHSDCRMSDTFH